MKKRILFTLFITFAGVFNLFAQKGEEIIPNLPIDEDTKLVTYQEVVQEPGTPEILFDRAMAWVKSYFKNSENIIQSSDKEKGIIMLRPSIRIYTILKDGKQHYKNLVYYNFKIECRNDRYRYTLTDFNEKAQSAAPIENWFKRDHPHWEPNWYLWLNQVNDEVIKITQALEEGMLPVEEKVDEW